MAIKPLNDRILVKPIEQQEEKNWRNYYSRHSERKATRRRGHCCRTWQNW